MNYNLPLIHLPVHTFLAGFIGVLIGSLASSYFMKQRLKKRKEQ
jgi:hypothetical protein